MTILRNINSTISGINSGLVLPTTLQGSFIDAFGDLSTTQKHWAVDIQFFRNTPSNLLKQGALTGTAGANALSNGAAAFTTGTGATSQCWYYTGTNLNYFSGCAVEGVFTAAFTAVGTVTGTMWQRIGLSDTAYNNGFYVGYEGNVFGITQKSQGINTRTIQSNFNGDLLTGLSTSAYTRGGVPEAVDFTKLQVFQIELGWVGGAPIYFKILSPDGNWVTFHTIKFPNTTTGPSCANADFAMFCDVGKSSSDTTTNLSVSSACWGISSTGTHKEIIKTSTFSVTNSATTTSYWAGNQLWGYDVYNPGNNDAYLEFFDAASVTLGTTVPVMVKGLATKTGASVFFPRPRIFANGIAVAAVTAYNGSVAPNQPQIVTLYFA
jgi:hypothetical protein